MSVSRRWKNALMIPLTLDEIIRETRGKPCRTLSPITVTGVSTDSRTCKPGDVFFAIRGERFDGHDFVAGALKAGAVAAFVDLPLGSDESPLVHVSDTIVALGELAAFHRRQQSLTVVAVTGSNGKTTVKSMIDHVLSRHLTGRASPQSFNNAIGVPLTLLSARAGDDYLVAEIGSNAPGEIAALGKMVAPGVAVITSIGEAHLSGLGDLGGAAVEKLSLLEHVRTGGIAVINADDFYGASAFQTLHDYLKMARDSGRAYDYCLVGYVLRNTLSDHGHVARGVCEATGEGYLAEINERLKIQKFGDAVRYAGGEGDAWVDISPESVVSMNMWGFTPSLFAELSARFAGFLDARAEEPGSEFLLPVIVGEMLADGRAKVKILPSDEKWFGVTYQEDKPLVQAAVRALHKAFALATGGKRVDAAKVAKTKRATGNKKSTSKKKLTEKKKKPRKSGVARKKKVAAKKKAPAKAGAS